jgi:hypothetical protein
MSCDYGRGGVLPPNLRDTVSLSPRGGAASGVVREPTVFLARGSAPFPKSPEARRFCWQEAPRLGASWERHKWMMDFPK